MIFLALNVDLNSTSFDPHTFKESTSVQVHQIWVPFSKRVQTGTNFLRIIISTADELSGDTNIDDLEP